MFTYFSNRIRFNATILPDSVLSALKTTPYVPERTKYQCNSDVQLKNVYARPFVIKTITFTNFFNALKVIYATHDKTGKFIKISHLFGGWYAAGKISASAT